MEYERLSRRKAWLSLLAAVVLAVGVLLIASVLGVLQDEPELSRPTTPEQAWWFFDDVYWERNRVAFLDTLYRKNPPSKSQIPVVELYLPDGSLEAMYQSIRKGDPDLGHDPSGDKPWYKCAYIDDTLKVQDGKAALRGASHWHHHLTKPSFRVKIKRKEVESGLRYIELSRPEDELAMSNWLVQRVAREFKLMTQWDEHVAFYLNNRYAGLYYRGSRPEEALALQNGRLPGTFFKGDLFEDPVRLWKNLDHWKISGEESKVADEAMLELLNIRGSKPTPDRLERVKEVLDDDAMARWSALMSMVGSAHASVMHNHLYFHDSIRGRLEPVVWDPNGFGLSLTANAPIDFFSSPIEDIFSDYPEWVHQRNLYLHELNSGLCNPASLGKRIDDELKKIDPWLEADPALGRIFRERWGIRLRRSSVRDLPRVRKELLEYIQVRHSVVSGYLADAKFSAEKTENGSRVTLFGSQAVLAEGPGSKTRLLYPGLARKRVDWGHGMAYRSVIQPSQLSYELPWKPSETIFMNAVTGVRIHPEKSIPQALEARSFQPKPTARNSPPELVLGPGVAEIQENLVLEPGQSLKIEPGTILRLAPGISIFCRGPVSALGTERDPIIMEASGAEPWGCFAVFGFPGESEFSHLSVSGGSQGRFGYLQFKGMFNVYNVSRVTLRNARFSGNRVSDDSVNIAETEVEIQNCEWEGGRADGLDLDQCKAFLRDCRFLDNGNDGLDVSNSQLKVTNCDFDGNSDKGFSVGEKSMVEVSESSFVANNRGLQVKDDSVVTVERSSFSNNVVDVEAYRKKWLYRRGGEIRLDNCQISGPIKLDRRSLIKLDGSPVPHDKETAYQSPPEGAHLTPPK